MSNVISASFPGDSLARDILSGPHKGWQAWELGNEAFRFQKIHDLVSAPAFDAYLATEFLHELTMLSRSIGYMDADDSLISATHATACLRSSGVNLSFSTDYPTRLISSRSLVR